MARWRFLIFTYLIREKVREKKSEGQKVFCVVIFFLLFFGHRWKINLVLSYYIITISNIIFFFIKTDEISRENTKFFFTIKNIFFKIGLFTRSLHLNELKKYSFKKLTTINQTIIKFHYLIGLINLIYLLIPR